MFGGLLVLIALFVAQCASCVSSSGVYLPYLDYAHPFLASDSQGQNYTFQLCDHAACATYPDAAVCQQTVMGTSISCGTLESRKVTVVNGGAVEVSFGNGTVCAATMQPRSTTVRIACAPNVFGLAVDAVEETQICQYVITARSASACASGATGSTCKYSVDGVNYDLNGVPNLSYTDNTDPSGPFTYQMNLCQPEPDTGSYIVQGSGSYVYSCRKALGPIQKALPYSVQLSYYNGDMCASGSPRQSTVNVVCGQQNAILNVTETALCNYSFYVTTPAACPSNRPQLS